MQEWILANKLLLIMIIFLDGVVLNVLGSKHKKHNGNHEPGMQYFWQLMKSGTADGVAATLLTFLAGVAALLLASTLL